MVVARPQRVCSRLSAYQTGRQMRVDIPLYFPLADNKLLERAKDAA